MHVVDAFPGRAPTTGLMLAARVYNDTDDQWRQGGNVVEWRGGVQVRRSGCAPVHAFEVPDCAIPAVPLANCVDDAPGFDNFRAFRLQAAVCASGACQPGLLEGLKADFAALHPYALARTFHTGLGPNPGLQNTATNLSASGAAASPTEGLATLMRARGIAGIGAGWLHVPPYAAPAVAESLADMTTAFGPPFEKVILDYGYPVTGPTGSTTEPGTAWLYTSGPVIVAVSTNPLTNERRPDGGDNFIDWEHGCYRPLVDRAAIVAWQTCGTFAVKIDTKGA